MKQVHLLIAPTTPRIQPGRDARGRFTKGNQWARLGWLGLVERRFSGDYALAKTWLGRVGVNAYAQQFTLLTPMMRMRLETVYAYPGTPEAFAAAWHRRMQPALPRLAVVVDGLDFDLASVGEMEF